MFVIKQIYFSKTKSVGILIVITEKYLKVQCQMMTPEQVQMYKDIVESVTGQSWDSDGWEVSQK